VIASCVFCSSGSAADRAGVEKGARIPHPKEPRDSGVD
jgi:hypothetical protein